MRNYRKSGGGKVVGAKGMTQDDFVCHEMVLGNKRERLPECELDKPKALGGFCPSLLSLEPQWLLFCSCST